MARGKIVETIFVNEYRTDRIFEVTESFLNPQAKELVGVREGNGADCGRSLSDYHVGDELIVHMHIWMDTVPMSSVSTFRPPPLRVKGNRVEGRIISEGNDQMSLARFRRLSGCHFGSFSFGIFPNPVKYLVQDSPY